VNVFTGTVSDGDGNTDTDTEPETITYTDVLPTVDLTKSVNKLNFFASEEATFTLTIHNTSPESVTITVLTDTYPLSTECLALIGTSIPAGGTVSCTYTVSHAESGSYDNTADVTVEDDEGNPASDFDSETINVYAPSVSKTADGTFDRTYLWTIDKSVDQTHVEILVGDWFTFHYAVTVSPNGFTDGGWEMSGEITVVNPHPDEDILVNITDAANLGPDATATCTVPGGSDLLVAAGTSETVSYSCTFSGAVTNPASNTVTVDWVAANPEIAASGTASDTVPVTFTLDQEINKTITVMDDQTDPTILGTWNWDDGPHTYTYTLDRQASYGCATYTNTAWIDETGQSDSETVEICGNYWAFTPGFWRNHTSADPSGHNAWLWTAYDPSNMLPDVFVGANLTGTAPGMGLRFDQLTLLQALDLPGGKGIDGATATLLRAGVAALLNASFHETLDTPDHPAAVIGPNGELLGPNGTIYYPYSSAAIIQMVVDAINTQNRTTILALAGELDNYNNGFHTVDWNWPIPPAPPVVTITSPVDGATVSGTSLSITADASSTVGVTQVEFFVNGAAIGTDLDGSDGWSITWNLTGLADENYTLTATAEATDGQTSSDSITVTVDNVLNLLIKVATLTGGSAWTKPNVAWMATATVTIDPALAGAIVTGIWSNNTTITCTTDSNGTCTVTLDNISKKTSFATFIVTDIALMGYNFDPSGPTTIMVYRPQ
jgi:uncharacterized repeat protein (TIGR01451 family)